MNEELIKIKLKGGLNNKIIRLQNVIPFALESKKRILEPFFGWPRSHKTEKFSNLFDIDYFNKQMQIKYNVKDIIVPYETLHDKKFCITTDISCYQKSQDTYYYFKEPHNYEFLNKLRTNMLSSLKPSNHIKDVIYSNKVDNMTAVQLRVESDWQRYTSHGKRIKKKKENETLLVSVSEFIEMYKKSKILCDKLFFTTGENHEEIKNELESSNINSQYFYDSNFGYETNAAINFFLCLDAHNFIGHTKSTFSQNLYYLRKTKSKDINTFMYNFNNRLENFQIQD